MTRPAHPWSTRTFDAGSRRLCQHDATRQVSTPTHRLEVCCGCDRVVKAVALNAFTIARDQPEHAL